MYIYGSRQLLPKAFYRFTTFCLTLSLMMFAESAGAQSGSRDIVFTQAGGTGFLGDVTEMELQPDGKIVVAGNFSTFNGISRRAVARLNSDGTLDPGFATVGTAFRNQYGLFQIRALALQPDGKMLVAGDFIEYNGVSRNGILRLNADGSLDTDFVPAAVIAGDVMALLVQPDGKILVGGGFGHFGAPETRYIVRLNSDGSRDMSFAIVGTGISGGSLSSGVGVHDIALQTNGKILIAGEFGMYNDILSSRVIRLNSDGSRDMSFAPTGAGINGGNAQSQYFVSRIALQRDGKVIAVGAFTAYNSIIRRSIVRLNTDGTLDQTFVYPAGGFNNNADAVVVQPDGKILVGGHFSAYGGVTRNRIARLNADGSLDTNFKPDGSGFNQAVLALSLQADGKILTGGTFFQYNGIAVPKLVRLNNTIQTVAIDDLAATTHFPGDVLNLSYTVYGTFNSGNIFTAQLSNASGSFTSPVAIGTTSSTASGTISATIPANTAAGTGYRIRIVSSNPSLIGPDNGVDLTVTGPASATISYPGSPFCNSVGMGLVTLNGTNGGVFSSTPGLVIESNTGAVNIALSDPGIYVVTYTAGSFSTTTGVAIRPAQPGALTNQAICAGSTFPGLSFTAIPGLQWNWTNTQPSIGLAASGSGNIPAFTALNSGAVPVAATIGVSASGGTRCAFRNRAFQISIQPTPSVQQPAGQALCAGSATQHIAFVTSVPGTTVLWTRDAPIGLAAAGAGHIFPFIASNTTGSVQTATITATPVVGGCNGASVNFAIQVSPSAGSLSYPGSPYCPEGRAVPTRSGSAGGSFSATPAGLDLNVSTGVVNLAGSQPGTYLVTYSVGAIGGCLPTTSASITIKPQTFINPIGNQVYCNGIVAPALPFTGNALSYTWANSDPGIGLPASGTGTSLPSFTTVNAGPGSRYATINVRPLGDGSNTCPGRIKAFRITVAYCPPVAQAADHGSDGLFARTALSRHFEAGPNPARSTVVLQYRGMEQGPFIVQLVSQYGAPIGRAITMAGTTYSMDLSNVRPGSYLLKVTHAKSGVSFTKQVIKL